MIDGWGLSRWNGPNINVTELHWWSVNRQQAITWANVDPDLCRHMASLGHNELMNTTATECYHDICDKLGPLEYNNHFV